MSGGDQDSLKPTNHELVFAVIRCELDKFAADPVGYIERERANDPVPSLGKDEHSQ